MPNLTTSSAVDAMMQAADAVGIRTAIGLGTAATATLSALLSDFTYNAATKVLSSTSTGASVTLPLSDATNPGLMAPADYVRLYQIPTKRLVGRNTASTGASEQVTADQVLDWIGTAAPGDLIYRDTSSYSRLAAPAANSILRFNGNSTIPAWSSQWTISSAGTMAWSQVAALTASTPAITISQTWNNAATTFKAATITITDTTSASGSLPFQILGGASGTTNLLSVDKNGKLTTGSSATSTLLVTVGQYGTATLSQGGGANWVLDKSFDMANGGGYISVSNDWAYFVMGTSPDTRLYRDAANSFAMRNGTNANSLAIYTTYTSSTSYERLRSYGTAASAFTLTTECGSGGGTIRGLKVGAGAAVGSNIAGADTTIIGGAGTGSGTPGSIVLQTATTPGGGSATTAGTLTDRFKVTPAGNFHSATTPSTGMTDGFIYIPSAAGAPTAAPPTAISGHLPMYYDSMTNKFYIYNGAWKSVTLA